jgi:hypothetical protein
MVSIKKLTKTALLHGKSIDIDEINSRRELQKQSGKKFCRANKRTLWPREDGTSKFPANAAP